ncbi:molybdopterin biosynthesis protein MoeY [Nitrosospira multiformis]|uniref:Nitroreductase family protein n=1 Tax=Nitrosospira multiformis TaxID=1231 RepID=A0A1I7GFP5_9PROT|nr:molybdopterin biosynthesis protein MoeY [Nitrosospira multiformis]SFU47228.1 Nitroreductase family protein [Nitrosospira multiformis]
MNPIKNGLDISTEVEEEPSHENAPSRSFIAPFQPSHPTTIQQILDLARWAPSGDNTQPWWFEIIDEHRVVIHGFDTREGCIYDLDGHGSQISVGALLETMNIAASSHGLQMKAQRRIHSPQNEENSLIFDVHFIPDAKLQPDPLIPYIKSRMVQRRPMNARKLSPIEKTTLAAAAGENYQIIWLEDFAKRWQTALLMFRNAKLRLTIPEAYKVHREIIKWGDDRGEEGLPAKTLGLDPLTLRLMQWVMKNWQRVEFFNTYLAGTLAPRIQMDLIPGIACSAHFVILADHKLESVDDYIDAGRAVQRFWLTLTKLGLFMQPELTPLIFATYIRNSVPFTKLKGKEREAKEIASGVNRLIGTDASGAVFMGRIGAGPPPAVRSERLPLKELMLPRKYHSPER